MARVVQKRFPFVSFNAWEKFGLEYLQRASKFKMLGVVKLSGAILSLAV